MSHLFEPLTRVAKAGLFTGSSMIVLEVTIQLRRKPESSMQQLKLLPRISVLAFAIHLKRLYTYQISSYDGVTVHTFCTVVLLYLVRAIPHCNAVSHRG